MSVYIRYSAWKVDDFFLKFLKLLGESDYLQAVRRIMHDFGVIALIMKHHLAGEALFPDLVIEMLEREAVVFLGDVGFVSIDQFHPHKVDLYKIINFRKYKLNLKII